ncbi:Hypothetical protein FKW44_003064, partial [Caligus rogercresseyi]
GVKCSGSISNMESINSLVVPINNEENVEVDITGDADGSVIINDKESQDNALVSDSDGIFHSKGGETVVSIHDNGMTSMNTKNPMPCTDEETMPTSDVNGEEAPSAKLNEKLQKPPRPILDNNVILRDRTRSQSSKRKEMDESPTKSKNPSKIPK